MNIQFSIVRNDDFETIGFHVYFGGHRAFTWGLADETSLYHVKKHDANEESMSKILELIELDKEIRVRQCFYLEFYQTAKENGIDTERGYMFTYTEEKLAAVKKRISNIINSFK